MSLFNLTNLLKYPTKPCTQTSQNHDASSPETGMGLPSDPTPPHLSQPSLSHRATGADPMMESDEYGAELGKEARVWKVYVKESDRSDTELVDGWNNICMFLTSNNVYNTDDLSFITQAALFSAISTAFLIESSKRLLQDPADVTAQTLLAISQTLSAIANGTQPLVSKSPAGDNTEEFFPSRTMVAINTLWYLSLSLSVATSLLAMLAKDWCHSFMTGRTGPAYNQTLRRQRKWTMIEKWKMQELIMVLPSLIHLSLLLFAVGLCIYVVEMNTCAGVPVICVTGAAVCFYVWSSLTATVVEHFPYTTVVSRLLRSDWAKQLIFIDLARRTSSFLVLLYFSDLFRWFESLDKRLQIWYRSLRGWAEEAEKALNLPAAKVIPSRNITDTDIIVSLALHWVITTCEAPYAVDIALQAIAGAGPKIHQGPQIDRGPLVACKAAPKISKRLASSNFSSAMNTHSFSLYVRALLFIGSNRLESISTVLGGKFTSELQPAIWKLQEQYEDRVAQLIEDGTFQPTNHNVEALRLASSIAIDSLQQITGSKQGSTVPDDVCRLLEAHCLQEEKLHPAALQALINATKMLSVCLVDHSVCLRLIVAIGALALDDDLPLSSEPHILSKQTLVECAYLLACNLSERHKSPRLNQLKLAETMVGYLTEDRGKYWSKPMRHVFSQLYSGLSLQDTDSTYPKYKCSASAIVQNETLNQLIGFLPHSRVRMRQRFHISMVYLWKKLIGIGGKQPTETYQFVTESIIYSTVDSPTEYLSRFLLNFPFPKLSVELVELLENWSTIPTLDYISNHYSNESQMLATSLLWTLCALVSYAGPGVEEIRDRLDAQLRRCTTWGDRATMKRALGYNLISHWLLAPKLDLKGTNYISIPGRLHLFRVVECVVEAGDHITPCIEVAVGEELADVKESLKKWFNFWGDEIPTSNRGLSSFTAYPTRCLPLNEQMSLAPHKAINISTQDLEDDEEDEIHRYVIKL